MKEDEIKSLLEALFFKGVSCIIEDIQPIIYSLRGALEKRKKRFENIGRPVPPDILDTLSELKDISLRCSEKNIEALHKAGHLHSLGIYFDLPSEEIITLAVKWFHEHIQQYADEKSQEAVRLTLASLEKEYQTKLDRVSQALEKAKRYGQQLQELTAKLKQGRLPKKETIRRRVLTSLLLLNTIDIDKAVTLLAEYGFDRRRTEGELSEMKREGYLERVDRGVYRLSDEGRGYIASVLIPTLDFTSERIMNREGLIKYLSEHDSTSKKELEEKVKRRHIIYSALRDGVIVLDNGMYSLTDKGKKKLDVPRKMGLKEAEGAIENYFREAGYATARRLREITGLSRKKLTPILKRLEEKGSIEFSGVLGYKWESIELPVLEGRSNVEKVLGYALSHDGKIPYNLHLLFDLSSTKICDLRHYLTKKFGYFTRDDGNLVLTDKGREALTRYGR